MDSFETTTTATLAETEAAVRSALQEQGFGVLTEIDVAATLRAKLGVDRAPLKILGACNPNFAQQTLDIDPAVALVLPCNVVLETTGAGTHVAIVDPRALDGRSPVRRPRRRCGGQAQSSDRVGGYAVGRVSVNVDPLRRPGELARMSPWCARARSRAMVRPMPLPPGGRAMSDTR